MSDILENPGRVTPGSGRQHRWREPAPEDTRPDGGDDSPGKRGIGIAVAVGLLLAAALIIALAVVTVTAGQPEVEVAGTTEVPESVPTSATPSSTSAPPSSDSPTSSEAPPTVPRSPIFLEPEELVLTTFYRSVPVDGGDFSMAVRLENTSEFGFAVADADFSFEVEGELFPAEEVITEHARVPAGGSAVVTLRVDLPAGGTPTLVVSSIDGELARAVLP